MLSQEIRAGSYIYEGVHSEILQRKKTTTAFTNNDLYCCTQ